MGISRQELTVDPNRQAQLPVVNLLATEPVRAGRVQKPVARSPALPAPG